MKSLKMLAGLLVVLVSQNLMGVGHLRDRYGNIENLDAVDGLGYKATTDELLEQIRMAASLAGMDPSKIVVTLDDGSVARADGRRVYDSLRSDLYIDEITPDFADRLAEVVSANASDRYQILAGREEGRRLAQAKAEAELAAKIEAREARDNEILRVARERYEA